MVLFPGSTGQVCGHVRLSHGGAPGIKGVGPVAPPPGPRTVPTENGQPDVRSTHGDLAHLVTPHLPAGRKCVYEALRLSLRSGDTVLPKGQPHLLTVLLFVGTLLAECHPPRRDVSRHHPCESYLLPNS